ncbi:MAG: hypothetical protein GY699_06685 [Desulfobacteraceae bacterium]|nr:hypothetical protein [Desulfobacteraceae bacterium]
MVTGIAAKEVVVSTMGVCYMVVEMIKKRDWKKC